MEPQTTPYVPTSLSEALDQGAALPPHAESVLEWRDRQFVNMNAQIEAIAAGQARLIDVLQSVISGGASPTPDLQHNGVADGPATGYSAADPTPRRAVASEFTITHEGVPHGGRSYGEGFHISWRDGVKDHFGSTTEDVLEACLQRLNFFQDSRFACGENADAIQGIGVALSALNLRTMRRQERGVEGTYQP